MNRSRELRKATSLTNFHGEMIRLTPDFMATLALSIGYMEHSGDASIPVETTTGVTVMTLSELYELRKQIMDQASAALKAEAAALA